MKYLLRERVKTSEEDERRIWRLATYNAEKGRGIVHTARWRQLMEEEQAWFDSTQRIA